MIQIFILNGKYSRKRSIFEYRGKPSSRSYFLDGVAGVANSGELAGSKMVGGNEVLCSDKTQWPLKYEEAARLIEIYTSMEK